MFLEGNNNAERKTKVSNTFEVADKLLVTVEEASAILSIARTRIFKLIAAGEIESVKIGKSRRIIKDSLNSYVERIIRETNV